MKKLLSLLIAITLLMFTSCASHAPQGTESVYSYTNSSDGLVINFLDVGQGSSVLAQCSGDYLLIDGGDRDYSSFVVSYLKNQGISELDYVIATHYDADHLNGVVGVLNAFDVGTVLCPDDSADSRVYKSFSEITDKKDIHKVYPDVGDTYTLGDASFTVICPQTYGSDSNNNSVGIKLSYGKTSAIFCGDAEFQSEEEMLRGNIDLDADIYYVSHHGSSSSSSDEFIKAISPEYAVISCAKFNSYGHPHKETLDTLSKYGCNVWRTDLQGTITCKSDGKSIQWSCESGTKAETNASETNSSEALTVNSDSTTESADIQADYVLNKSTKKFHLPTCPSCDDMKDENKDYFSGTRKDLINSGYTPCGRCNP